MLHTAQLLVGRAFLSTGLLLFAFVAYQLWGTKLQEARAQDGLSGQFEEVLAKGTAAPTPTTTSLPTTSAATVAPSTGTTPTSSTAPTTTAVAPTTARPTATAPATPVANGDPIARLVIPKIGVDKIVVSGVTVDALRKGPGHFPDTPMPGERGNASIAGHRTTFGAPFNRVDELETGDSIQVTTVKGTFVYLVTGIQIVGPDRYDVVGPTDTPVLTLISCHPKLSATNRIVVSAALDPTASSSVTEPAVRTPPAATGVLPGDDATAAASVASGSAPVGSTAPGASVAPPAAIGGDVGGEGATGAGASATTSQAFQQTWFSDQLAWADVAIWGGVLTGLSLLAWQLSRRTRNLVGGLVGIVPFVVVLYFFFENVSRLLPPNL